MKNTAKVVVVVWLVALASLLASSATGRTSETTSGLHRKCVQAALKKPKIVKIGIKHAGQVGYGSDPRQTVFLTARYKAMPDECQDDYHRGNSAKAQMLYNGNWINSKKWGVYHGWGGLYSAVVDDEGQPVIDPQTSFKGTYSDFAGIHDQAWYLTPCRVRILIKENVTHPTEHHYPDSGYHPPDFSNNIAYKIYSVNVPPSHIWPHSFRRQHC